MGYFRHLCVLAILCTCMTAVDVGIQPAFAGSKEDCSQDKDLELSVKGCTEALNSHNMSSRQFAMTYYFRGNALRRLGEIERALEDLHKAISIDASYKQTYIDLGIIYKNRLEYDKAISYYDEALRIKSDFAQALYNRGNAYLYQNQNGKAVEDYHAALKARPSYGLPYIGLAWAHYSLEQNQEALKNAEKAIDRYPNYPSIIDIRARILSVMGRRSEAIIEFERAAESGGIGFVKNYQNALAKMQFYDGEVDGIFGTKTRIALATCVKQACRIELARPQ